MVLDIMDLEHKYIVYDVSDALSSGAVEYMGGKPKGWLTFNLDGKDLRVLFKEGRPGTGENWAEKVACELAELLELPQATYELAYLDKDRPCVISPSFLNVGEELVLGNQLIEGFDKNQKYKNTKHTLKEILTALDKNAVQLPWKTLRQDLYVNTAKDLFIGYLCFDAWIANTDRHAENWGMIIKPEQVNVLAHTFDHASSLGRNESDQRRKTRMVTKDTGFNVRAYVQKAMTATYDENGRLLSNMDLIKSCKELAPEATNFWIKRIDDIMNAGNTVRKIVDQIPDDFISDPSRDFIMAILNTSAAMLGEL